MKNFTITHVIAPKEFLEHLMYDQLFLIYSSDEAGNHNVTLSRKLINPHFNVLYSLTPVSFCSLTFAATNYSNSTVKIKTEEFSKIGADEFSGQSP